MFNATMTCNMENIWWKGDGGSVQRKVDGEQVRRTWGRKSFRGSEGTCLHHVLSSGTAGDVFGVHGDEVVYDDGAHSKGTESVGEGV